VIQGLVFVIKEGFVGLVRARVSGVVATLTVAISLILIGVFLIITVNLGRFVENLRSRVELEVFLEDTLTEENIQSLMADIEKIEGVSEIIFISKEMAILEFRNLFKEEQKDYFETLGYNPLPASFRVKLEADFQTAAGAEHVFNELSAIRQISAEDVVYRKEYLILLEKYIKIAVAVALLVGIVLCISALLLVSNNIKLIIFSKAKIIETMKLVGATRFFIQMPLHIQGTIQGFVGGIVSALFLYGLLRLGSLEIPGLINVNWKIYFLLSLMGALLGISGSLMAVRRYL